MRTWREVRYFASQKFRLTSERLNGMRGTCLWIFSKCCQKCSMANVNFSQNFQM